MFIINLFEDTQFFVYWVTIIILSVCFHEFCHAFAAYSQGDDTGKQLGFFTIDPMLQMGAISLVMLLFFGLCWGACPVNPSKFRKRYSDVLVSLAGPFGNFALAILFGLLNAIFIIWGIHFDNFAIHNLEKLFWYGCYANIVLLLFNIIPVYPLDGHKLIEYIYPKSVYFYQRIGYGGFVILFILLSVPLFATIFWCIANSISSTLANTFETIFMHFILHILP